jgi:hypothetical protein
MADGELKAGVDVHKKTTKVNLSVVIAVVLFLAIGAAAMVWFWQRSSQ